MTPAELAEQICELLQSETQGWQPVANRIVANRLIEAMRFWEWLPLIETRPRDLVPMSDLEARAYENQNMEFGKYNEVRIGDIPLDHLEWVADAGRKTWRQIHAYLESPRIKQEREEHDH